MSKYRSIIIINTALKVYDFSSNVENYDDVKSATCFAQSQSHMLYMCPVIGPLISFTISDIPYNIIVSPQGLDISKL